jgi:hypothetical protein
MQLLLKGVNPLFWNQVSELSDGVYNKENNQASSATINQLLVAFVDLTMGTILDIWMSVDGGTPVKVTSAKILDTVGTLYAKFPIPYSKNMNNIEIQIAKQAGTFNSNNVVSAEIFATSHIAYLFEIQSQTMGQILDGEQQLEQDITIEGVDEALLEEKFGQLTGLNRRTDQTSNQYRAQTACLWKAFQYSSMEKGIRDAISCLIGRVVGVTVTPTKSVIPNLIFDAAQFDNRYPSASFPNFIVDQTPPLTRNDVDSPHFYIPEIGSEPDFHVDGDSLATLDTLAPVEGTYWDESNVQVLTVHTTEAVGSEVIAEMTSSTSIGLSEEAALANVLNESILRKGGTGSSNPDLLFNGYIASMVKVNSVIIGGLEKTLLTDLPQDGVDFIVDRKMGQIIWDPFSIKIPDTNTVYGVTYDFRLDESLRIVINKIKPVQKKVVIVFSNMISDLPRALVI